MAQNTDRVRSASSQSDDALLHFQAELTAARSALRASEARFRSIVEGSRQGIIIQQDDRIVYANDAMAELFGYDSAGAMTGLNPFDDLIDGDPTEFRSRTKAAYHGARVVQTPPWRARHCAGKQLWISSTAHASEWNDRPAVTSFYNDVTERQVAETALRDSEARLAVITENAPVGIGLCDRDGRWVVKNPVLDRVLGEYIASQDLEQQARWHPVDDAGQSVPPENWPAARALRGETVAPGLDFQITVGGEVRWLNVSAAPVKSGDEVQCAVVILEDVTARRQSEQQLDVLLREVNHRSKNMLSVVQAIARATAGTEDKAFAAKFEQRIQALSASQDLLVSRAWRGVCLVELVRAQLAHLEDLVGEQIIFNGPRVLISAAAAQALSMALHELATNACKYGALSVPQGRVQIEWGFASPEREVQQRFWMNWCESGGPAAGTPTTTGFGSTVIRDVTRASLEAEVRLDFAPSGLVWQLECPFRRVVVEVGAGRAHEGRDCRAEKLQQAFSHNTAAPEHGRSRILVVEDEALVASVMSGSLIDAGFEVVGPASSVREALALLATEACDAAILDVNLGEEISEAIAEKLGSQSKPFLLVSGYSHRQLPVALRHAPLLAKPVRGKAMLAELKRVLCDTGDRR